MFRLIPAIFLAMVAAPSWAQAPAAQAPAAQAPVAKPPAPHSRTATPTLEQRFEAANTTHDGQLTKAQAHTAKMTSTVKNFDAIDKDKKGFVTLEDLRAYSAGQRAQRQPAKTPPAKS